MKATHVRAIHYVKLGSVIKDIDVLTLKVELMLIKVYLRENNNNNNNNERSLIRI